MADTTADNQATKPTPSTPLAPTPDLGDGPWDMSTGINNPNNQRDYTREPKGTINTNGGLLGVMGNVFDKLMELLARLFGNLIGKDTESIADKKADVEFNLENFAAAKKEYDRGKDKSNDHYSVNKSLNIPEYANKDIASEYLMFTHFGNAKIMLSGKDGSVNPVFEASIKENFMRCFSISIDQIKGYKDDKGKDIKDSVPFSVWMASPVYKRSFDASIDKDALLAGLSTEEKELLKKAKYMDKAQRDGLFKEHPELEDKFTFVRNTALAVSNADIMANTITVESSITNTAIADFRFAPKDQMGAFQLTAQTALEFAGKTFDEKERISLGQKVLAELNINGKPKLSEAEVKNMVEHILGSDAYGGNRTLFISSLTTHLNNCKNQKEFEAMVGSVAKIFGDENNYLQLQQNIMSAKMAWAINGVGGSERFNKIMQEGKTQDKGQLIVDMSNYYKDKFKDGAPFTAKELYNMFTGGKEAKTEDDALFELGKLAENDSKIVFAVAHAVYHGNTSKIETAKTFTGVDLFTGKAAIAAEKQAVEIAANSLTPVPKDGLNADGAEKDWLIANAAKLVNGKDGTMLTLHQDEAFKNYDMVKGTSAKEMLEMLEKAKISKEDRENPVFQSFLQKLKDHPEAHIDGTPYEYIVEISKRIEEKGTKDALSADISQIKKDVESRRYDNEDEVMKYLAFNSLKEKTFGDLLNAIDTNGQRRMIVEQYLAKNPDAKGFVDFWKSHQDASLIHYGKFSELVDFYAKNHKEITENGKSVEDIVSIAASQKIDDFKRQTLTYLDRRIGVEGDEKMRNYHIHSGPTIANTYASLDDLVKDAKDVMSLYQSDKSLNHKDFIQSHDDLAKLFNVVTYGPAICTKMGLPYEKLKEILVNELIKEGMFNISSIGEQQNDAEKFIKAMADQKRDAFKEFSSLTMSKRYEEGMESIFVGHEITPALASFLIKKGILKDEAFSSFSMFDDMDEIKVKLDDGTTVSLNRFGLGTSNHNFAEEYYADNFKKQNDKWASLAKEKGIEDKTNDSSKGLDAEALAKVKDQANNKKIDVKVASLDR